MEYHLETADSISPEFENLLFIGLNENARQSKGMDPIRTFSVEVKDANQNLLGGICGITYYGCLYTDMLWLDPSARNIGLGARLMYEAEKIASIRGCTFATVNTMDFEALTFYQKLGYEIEFTRTGYEKGSSKYMLRKSLS